MSAWIRGEVDVDDSRDTGAVWIVRVRWEDLNGTYLSYSNAEVGSAAGGLPSSFAEKGGTVTAPAGAVYGRAEVYFYLASGWLNVDDVKVTPTTTVNVSETLYYSFGGDTVGMRVDGELSWIFSDQLGSTGITYQADGSATVRQFYYPYGGIRNPGGSPVINTDVGFTGQRLDTSTGLMFYQARYYDPLTARFISADAMVPSLLNPQDLNRFSYVRNNPLRYTDPTGNCIISATLVIDGDDSSYCGGWYGYVRANIDPLGGTYQLIDTATDDAIVVWGSLDAANVVIHFPGTGNRLANLENSIGDAKAIYDAATFLDPDTAVVLCLCYDVPRGLTAAALGRNSDFGFGTVLKRVTTLGLTGSQFVTASGHSFGARAAYTLYLSGIADQAVLAAPASLSADVPWALRRGDGWQRRLTGVYTGRADDDLIRFVSDIYGAEFDTGAAQGHSQYYKSGKVSVRSIALLVVGRDS